jgi:hypothetical protein
VEVWGFWVEDGINRAPKKPLVDRNSNMLDPDFLKEAHKCTISVPESQNIWLKKICFTTFETIPGIHKQFMPCIPVKNAI